jgi:hypothetical protein
MADAVREPLPLPFIGQLDLVRWTGEQGLDPGLAKSGAAPAFLRSLAGARLIRRSHGLTGCELSLCRCSDPLRCS